MRLPENQEQPIDLFYAFVYVTDLEEGLVIVNVATLVDGNPENNFLKKDVVFNPDGILTGATFVAAAGHRLYLTTPRGLVIVDVSDPMHPRVAGGLNGNFLRNPHCIAIQFRYAFVTDDDGLKILDITDPVRPHPIRGGVVPLRNAGRLTVGRTYAYVANGPEGLAIVDVENPERPRLDQMFSAGGAINDARAVQIGSVNASQFASGGRWEKRIACHSTHLARHRSRRDGLQSAPESESDRHLPDARRSGRGFAWAGARPGGG